MARPRFAHWDLVSAYNVRMGKEACAAIDALALAMIDVNMPGGGPMDVAGARGGGFDVVRSVREKFPFAPVAVLSADTSLIVVEASLRLGAEFVPKNSLHYALSALSGRAVGAANGVTVAQQGPLVSAAEQYGLSHQQIRVLALAVGGMKQQAIGKALGISYATVKRHTEELLKRSGATSLAELAQRVRTPLHRPW